MMCFKQYMDASNHESDYSNPKFFIPNLTPADLTERLPELNKEQFEKVKVVLENNKAERHLRGGEATRKKYAHQLQSWTKNEKNRKLDRKMTCINGKKIIQ